MEKQRTIISISDLKKIIRTVDINYNLNLSDYAVSSLKRRIESFIDERFIQSPNNLIDRIERQELFGEIFIQSILAPDSEMFRDYNFWLTLSNIIKKKYINKEMLEIWLPCANSYHNLFTLQIVLDKLKMIEKSKVTVSSTSKLNANQILSESLSEKNIEQNIPNHKRFDNNIELKTYFNTIDNNYVFKNELLSNVEVKHHNFLNDEINSKFDIVIFRDKMLYYNLSLKNHALNIITSNIKLGGYLAIGIKEIIDYPLWHSDYYLFNESESIYKKRII